MSPGAGGVGAEGGTAGANGQLIMRDGLPVSGREGHGYGCRSIRSIAVQKGGLCVFDTDHGVFTIRVMLPLKDQ